MNFFVEKYDPTKIFHSEDKIMTKRIIPGLYFWALIAPIVAMLFLSVFTNPHWIFGIFAMLPAAFVLAMVLDIGLDKDYEPRQWRMFNRGRKHFYSRSYGRIDFDNAGPETAAKLKEYLDHIRSDGESSEEVEVYIRNLHLAEQNKIRAYENLVGKECLTTEIVDMSIIERLRIEAEELNKVVP